MSGQDEQAFHLYGQSSHLDESRYLPLFLVARPGAASSVHIVLAPSSDAMSPK